MSDTRDQTRRDGGSSGAERSVSPDPFENGTCDPFSLDETGFDRLDAFVTAAWKRATTHRERVWGVIRRTTTFMRAEKVARFAEVSSTETATILETLSTEGRVATRKTVDETLYRRDPGWHEKAHLSRIITLPGQTLRTVLGGIRQEILEYRQLYDAETPGELARKRDELPPHAGRALSEWRTARVHRRRLRVAIQLRWAVGTDDQPPTLPPAGAVSDE